MSLLVCNARPPGVKRQVPGRRRRRRPPGTAPDLGPHCLEARGPEGCRHGVGGLPRVGVPCALLPGLERQGHRAPGCHDLPETAEHRHRIPPEHVDVDRVGLVEAGLQVREVGGRPVDETHPPLGEGSRVPAARRPDHGLRVVQAGHRSRVRARGGLGEGHPGSEAQLQDPVAACDAEAIERGRPPRSVRGPPGHDCAGEAAQRSPGPAELGHQRRPQPAHGPSPRARRTRRRVPAASATLAASPRSRPA